MLIWTVECPKGSVLGPLLFSLYILDVLYLIALCGLLAHVYADDAECYQLFVVQELPDVIQAFQDCFVKVSEWMASNRLKLNPDKTELIVFGPKNNLGKVNMTSMTLDGTLIPLSSQVRDLGVILDSELTFEQHSKLIFKACMYTIKQQWIVKSLLTRQACETLVSSLIMSRVDYCNGLLAGCN